MYLYLDIETFGGEKPTQEELFAKIKPAPQCKSDKSREENVAKQQKAIMDNLDAAIDKEWRSRALDLFKAEIICIGCKLGDDESVAMTHKTCAPVSDNNEFNILSEFDQLCASTIKKGVAKFITWNGSKFDVAMLWLRAMKYGFKNIMKVLPTSNKDRNNVDLPLLVTPTIWNSYYSLASICEYFDIPVKSDGITGATVHDEYLAGNIDGIAAYCIEDVEVLPLLAEKMGVSKIDLDDVKS